MLFSQWIKSENVTSATRCRIKAIDQYFQRLNVSFARFCKCNLKKNIGISDEVSLLGWCEGGTERRRLSKVWAISKITHWMASEITTRLPLEQPRS